jgi:N-acetylglucosaminyl-diphospho-decaprenol L-rhamnosyltransferase
LTGPLNLSQLSVVIVNYNAREDLRACLTALAQCQPTPEIIVVDNGSTDGSAEMCSEAFPDVVLLAPGRNLWFTGGNNLGVAVAHGEFVLLLNPDTLPTPAALRNMVMYAESHPDCAGVTVQLRYPDSAIQRTGSHVPTYRYLLLNHTPLGWLMRDEKTRVNALHWYAEWGRDTDCDIEVPPGSCLLARRVGLRMDDDLRLYFPEDDLARRSEGAKFRFLADTPVIHREKSVTKTWLATHTYFRDMLVYTRKHHGWPAMALLWLLSRPLLWGMAVKRRIKL